MAATTITNLIVTNKARKLRTQFLKSYSTIQQVFKQMQTDDIYLDPADYPIQEYYHNENYKSEPCFDHTKKYYKNMQGEKSALNGYINDGEWLLPDGSLLLSENGGAQWGSLIWVTVDLNMMYSHFN